ncbi:metallophosphoesterase [Curtobacterium poinsettiae]|uniref:metallophosphoesterase n=1 Tax=Curtobacterium poinsettiae TaxID=159612 RepID=UPI001BDF1083|nr:metallophosphoesterase [Curtobacterium flaccumfaciens pv. poinsettiae]
MKQQLAFVGDIHGNVRALRTIWRELGRLNLDRVVFLGDYINKGYESSEVMSTLLEIESEGRATLLRGNHETAFLSAVEDNVMGPFLKMGGALTIRSYVGGAVKPSVWEELRNAVPAPHVELVRRMPQEFTSNEVQARHEPWDRTVGTYAISAHIYIGREPKIGSGSAQIDTGCGDSGGRLTALLWPSLKFIQADEHGNLIPTS